MSGQGKKVGKKSGSRSLNADLGDLTLADYANSNLSSGKNRLRKGKTSFNVVKEVKQLNIDDKAWDEKLDDFEGDFDFVKEENEDGKEVYVMRKASCRRKKTLSESMAKDCTEGNVYPLDIWHLIAEYIRPEDIATFSAICRNSWSVTKTPTFWLKLYKRYYKKVPNLPSRLKPECIVRHHGLKACVIRALFYMYPPLAARVDRGMGTPYDLKSRQCISMWQERYSNSKWKLNFKLRRKDFEPSREEKTDLLEILGDIFANADDGCTVLQVVSSERAVLPVVMGLTLHSIKIELTMTAAHMNVQLVFGSGLICNGKLDTTGLVSLSLKNVLQVSVLEWWHPRYPHSSNTIIRTEEA